MTSNDKQPVPLWEFWNKHSMPPLARPSCFVCGQTPKQWPPAVQHLELPSIVCCHACKDAASQLSQARANEGRLREALEALEAISRRAPIMASRGEHRDGQLHALEACREVAAKALAAKEQLRVAREAARAITCIEVGNWYSEYKCARCGATWVQNDDAPKHEHRCSLKGSANGK